MTINETWFENWWPAWYRENPYATDREIALTAHKAGVAHSQHYVADDELYPKRVAFANGRVVAYKMKEGRAFLVVGMETIVEASSQLRCPNADDCYWAFDACFPFCSLSDHVPSRDACLGTWNAAVAWCAFELQPVNPESAHCKRCFDTWFHSNTDIIRVAVWSLGWDIWKAAVHWTRGRNESDKAPT